MTGQQNPRPTVNVPIYSLLALVVVVAAGVVLYATGSDGRAALFIGALVTTLPSLIASLSAERNARDIRNGTLTEKAREGAHAALREAGVPAQLEQLTKSDDAAHGSGSVPARMEDRASE